MRALREVIGVEPVEYPTTRHVGASPEARAHDLMEAFSDPTIEAVLASIGGEDQITVLPHIDPAVLMANPTRFFGYSDNTNLLNYLWNLGIVSYHGGSTMVHLARPGGLHPVTLASLEAALFTSGTVEVPAVEYFSDLSPEWSDLSTLDHVMETTHDPGWIWRGPERSVTAPTWGGNLEILSWNLAANRWTGPPEAYDGCIMLIETSEEMPSSTEVFRMLRNAGERGVLGRLGGVVVAKPKAWSHDQRLDPDARAHYREDQRAAVERALKTYAPEAPVVFGVDFGHTDPQIVIPYGGLMTLDGASRRIFVTY